MPDPPDISLPPTFRRTLDFLRALSDEDFVNFIQVLSNVSPSLRASDVTNRFKDALPNGNPAIVTGLLEFALSTRRLVFNLHEAPDTIAEAIVRAYAASVKQDPELLRAELHPRVLAVLNSDFVAIREKSIDLAAEAPLILRSARSITDLRPIFAADGSTEDLAGFVIIHTLKLDIHGGDREPLFVVLDHDAVNSLKEVLNRALEKETRLARLLSESKIPDLSLRSDQ